VASPSLVHSVIGDYRLLEFLGAGGMGEVYRAVHTKIGRSAAVKILTAAAPGSDFLQRFLNEARVHASLQHPNIATLYDFLEFNGRPCIIMEYVDGQTLVDRIRLQGPLHSAEAWPIFLAIVSAVAYVHDQGIIHRDLKTANIRINSQGVVKLLDFGIAKGMATPDLTQVGNVIGTLTYMPPEQLRGEPASTRSDVWALGIVLYEMLTGRVPFEARTAGELIEKIRTGNYARLATLRAGADPLEVPLLHRADQVVARCLRRSPMDRYPNARAVLDEIPATVAPAKGEGAALVAAGGAAAALTRKAQVWLRQSWEALAAAVRPARAGGPASALPPVLEWFGRYWAALAAAVRPARAGGPASALPPVLELFGRYWAYLAVAALIVVGAVWLTLRGPGSADDTGKSQAPVAGSIAAEDALSIHRIEVAEGIADVYVNNELKGRTPFEYRARPNETATIGLKQQGFADFQGTFDVTTRKVWTLVMKRETARDQSR